MNFEIPNHERISWNKTLKVMKDITKSGAMAGLAVVSIRADDTTQELELFISNGSAGSPVEFIALFDGLIYEGGECMMDAAHFSKLATMEKNEALDFRINPSACIIKGKDRFVELPKIKFVPIERSKIPTLININKDDFKTAIKNVGSNLKKNADKFGTTLKIGSGNEGTTLEFFSADHHRMTMSSVVQVHQLTKEIAIHQNSLRAILLFLELEGDLEWGFDEKSMFFKSGHMLLLVPLIEAYEASIAQLFQEQDSTDIQLKIDAKEIVEAAVKCKAIFSIKKFEHPAVSGELVNGVFTLKASAGDLVVMNKIECEIIKGKFGKFKLQPAYLENSLKNIDDATALICFNDGSALNPVNELSGVIITGGINDTTKHLIMQMRISENE